MQLRRRPTQSKIRRPQLPGQAPILRLAFDGHTGKVLTLDISDGGRTLISAGEDKEVHVWRRTDVGDTGWLHRRTIRWPVTRGPRGRIYAARLNEDLVAFAGHGAFGYLGEIRVVDVASGDLKRTLADQRPGHGHQQNVVSLSWSPGDESRLASVDMDGRLILWAADPASWNLGRQNAGRRRRSNVRRRDRRRTEDQMSVAFLCLFLLSVRIMSWCRVLLGRSPLTRRKPTGICSESMCATENQSC